jgi:exopolysaccharide biosynthesis polyprenyl glycosylphosphotransferase
VGAGRQGRDLAAALSRDPRSGVTVRGFVDERAPIHGDVHGRICDLASVVRSEFVDEVILVPPHDYDTVRRVAREARRNRTSVAVMPELFGFPSQSVSFSKVGSVPVLRLYEEQRPRLGLLLKRAFDVVSSTLGLTAVLPLLVVLACLVKLGSPGPVFYRGLRIGRRGRSFICYKFRTMFTGADDLREELRSRNERKGPIFKIANDPRITRFGHFLRHYSLDELPQLWNVLKGDMSLVGPRPHPLDDFERYEVEHLRRLDVTPGMTGLWQVTARQDASFERNMELDLEYIERWSFWLDLRILFATLPAVLQGSGA